MEKIYMNIGNNKTNEPHKFILNLLQRLDLRYLNKQVALIYLLQAWNYNTHRNSM